MGNRGMTQKGRWQVAGGLMAAVLCATSFGCATGRVSNVDAYEDVPMNRVVPYPSQDELRKRSFDLVIVERPAVGIDEDRLAQPRAQVRRALEDIAADAGASIVDRTVDEPDGLPAEGEDGSAWEEATPADFALATRFSKYGYASSWKKPFKMPWQSDEEVASKPGTCEHMASVELDVEMRDLGNDDAVVRTFVLTHEAQQETKDLDPACALPAVTLTVLFEKALDEALSCLDLPLGAALAPRGHVTGHRKAPGADRHIYRITLGSGHGLDSGDSVEIRREQRSMTPDGEETREERVIATGEVTDQVRAQQSWIAADPSKANVTILDGDVVRPVYAEGLLSSLTGPDCDAILIER